MFMAPLALQMDFALSIWLKIVPDYAGIFCQLSIVNTLIWIAFSSVLHGITSTGKNRTFRKIDSLMTVFIFPFTYLGLHFSPIGYICSQIFVNIFRMVYWMLTLSKLADFSIRRFFNQSLLKCFIIGATSIPLPFYIALNMNGWQGFLACLIAFFALFTPSVLFIGLDGSEREKLVGWVKGNI
jgi:hypothetical protein